MEDQASPQPAPGAAARQIYGIGARLLRAKRFDEAAAAFEAALALEPDYADAHNDLGITHQRSGRVEEAMAAYRRAAAINPGHAKAHSNLGAAHMDRNEPDLAIAAYRRSLEINRFQPKVVTNLAFAQLLRGDLLAGWRNYEVRWAAGATRHQRALPGKTWLGERPLRGRSILLCSEQGFGDMMQFARFVPLVAALGARVHLEAKQPLQRLFRASFPEVEAVHVFGAPVPECDEYTTVPSLPMAFATELATVPARVPYLRAPERWPAALAAMLPRPPLARIGIAWSGDPLHHNDGNRSIPFKRFRSLIEGAARPFISLQKEVREIDRVVLAATPAVTNFARQIRDFADTAALIGEVDLVIAVDTSVAHLAGALGKPVWLLLPFAPDWRWLLERSDSPWYPTMRLFRQPRPGDWDAVFASVQAELNALFPSHS